MRGFTSSGVRAKTLSTVAPALYAGISTKTFSPMSRDGYGFTHPVLVDMGLHGGFNRIADAPDGLPAQQGSGLRNVWDAAGGVVITLPVELVAGHADDLPQPYRRVAGLCGGNLTHRLRHLPGRELLVRRAHI